MLKAKLWIADKLTLMFVINMWVSDTVGVLVLIVYESKHSLMSSFSSEWS